MLEFLRRTEVVGPKGNKVRLLDAVDVITGVSGGSFTALAYGLYGDKLFDEYEQRFLKRNVQGEIIARTFSPANWGNLASTGWGRSELAAQLYDEILFNGATFGDLNRGKGPMILASATDISTGSRFVFNQNVFDVICSDLNADAAVARRGGVVGRAGRALVDHDQQLWRHLQCEISRLGEALHRQSENPPRPAARAIRSLTTIEAFGDSVHRPYSISWTAAYPTTWACAACWTRWKSSKRCTKRASRRRSTARAGSSSLSSIRCPRLPPTGTNRRIRPGTVDILLKSAGIADRRTIPTRRSNC